MLLALVRVCFSSSTPFFDRNLRSVMMTCVPFRILLTAEYSFLAVILVVGQLSIGFVLH